jgi:hypothetical protein
VGPDGPNADGRDDDDMPTQRGAATHGRGTTTW